MISGARESVASFTLATCAIHADTASVTVPKNWSLNRKLLQNLPSVTGFVLKSNLSDNSDVTAGSSRPVPSQSTNQLVHSLNET